MEEREGERTQRSPLPFVFSCLPAGCERNDRAAWTPGGFERNDRAAWTPAGSEKRKGNEKENCLTGPTSTYCYQLRHRFMIKKNFLLECVGWHPGELGTPALLMS